MDNFSISLTEKIEKPKADSSPNSNPAIEFSPVASMAIIAIPVVAIKIDIQTFIDISSFKNKKPNNAVINGIAARHSKVTAAVV